MPDFAIERRHKGLVCGVDEAGRGPLAGPVVAAAVILDPRRLPKTLRDGLDDSKVLTPEQREVCYRALMRCVDRGTARIGVGAAGTREIDRINILRAALSRSALCPPSSPSVQEQLQRTRCDADGRTHGLTRRPMRRMFG